jgi:hypothetical protein
MMAKALIQRWPISVDAKAQIIERLVDIVSDPSSSPREVTAAAKGLLSAEKQNQDDEHKVVDVRIQSRHAELDAIAADLGVDLGVVEDASRKAEGGTVGPERIGGS